MIITSQHQVDAAIERHNDFMAERANQAQWVDKGQCPVHGTRLVNIQFKHGGRALDVQATCPRLQCSFVTDIETGSRLAVLMLQRPRAGAPQPAPDSLG